MHKRVGASRVSDGKVQTKAACQTENEEAAAKTEGEEGGAASRRENRSGLRTGGERRAAAMCHHSPEAYGTSGWRQSCVESPLCRSVPSSRRSFEARHPRLPGGREAPVGFGHHSEAAEIGGNSVTERVRGARASGVFQRDSLQQALRRSVAS